MQGVFFSWVLVNLIFALGLVPSSWFRIISLIRKRGPVVVAKLENLRPVCYVSDLEGVVDLVWLHLFKQSLIDYAGSSQVGGQMDPVLVTIGILTALQSRLNANLPSMVLKADLLQGYDLAWRDAVRLHAWHAGIQGNGWLFLDCCLAVDQARVRMGPLLGPFFVILNHGIRQGGRSAVQLFGAFAKGLADAVGFSSVGVGLGRDPTVARCVLGDKQRTNSIVEPSWGDLWAAAKKFIPKASQMNFSYCCARRHRKKRPCSFWTRLLRATFCCFSSLMTPSCCNRHHGGYSRFVRRCLRLLLVGNTDLQGAKRRPHFSV